MEEAGCRWGGGGGGGVWTCFDMQCSRQNNEAVIRQCCDSIELCGEQGNRTYNHVCGSTACTQKYVAMNHCKTGKQNDRGFPTRMVYFYYISCLRFSILVGKNFDFETTHTKDQSSFIRVKIIWRMHAADSPVTNTVLLPCTGTVSSPGYGSPSRPLGCAPIHCTQTTSCVCSNSEMLIVISIKLQ